MTQSTAATGTAETPEVPWYQSGEDYGRDLGTGVPEGASDAERRHQADVPRFYEGPDDPLFPARPEGSDAEETAVASAPAVPPVPLTPPQRVLTPLGGQADQDDESSSGSEGSSD